jgi:hypothetical protein
MSERFTPVKLSMRANRGPTQTLAQGPQWLAEWAAPSGMRLVGSGDNPFQACADLARQAMLEDAGITPDMSPESAEYLASS